MGRTNPTMRDQLDRLEREWQPFRRSLRRRHQPSFDALFERARGHADAATQQNPRDPWRALVFAALLAQERELANLRERVDELEGEARPEGAPREGERRAKRAVSQGAASGEDDDTDRNGDADRHGDSDGDSDSDRTADSEQPVRSSSEPHRNRDSDRTADRDADSDADDP